MRKAKKTRKVRIISVKEDFNKEIRKPKQKDYVAMLNDNKDMPKMVIVTDEKTINTYGGNKMIIAPPLYYDALIKQIPYGKIVLDSELRNKIAKDNGADFTDPMTAGIFINICAHAYKQSESDTPYWRVVKKGGILNYKFPGGEEVQTTKLREEGMQVHLKGRVNQVYYVENFEEHLFKF